MVTFVSGGSRWSGASKHSPRSTSGGWPRSVGNDRSGVVVFTADPNSETARIASSTLSPTVMVPDGDSWSERAASPTVVGSSNSMNVVFSARRIWSGASAATWSFIGPTSTSSEYRWWGYSSTSWLADCPTYVPSPVQTETFNSCGSSSCWTSKTTALSTGSANRSSSTDWGSTRTSVYSSNCAFSIGSCTRSPVGRSMGANVGFTPATPHWSRSRCPAASDRLPGG